MQSLESDHNMIDFNPTIVRFKLADKAKALSWQTTFQSYYSSIQTLYIGSTISQCLQNFNPTIVRFKHKKVNFQQKFTCNFNPTIVRFKRLILAIIEILVIYFNPTIVRFKLLNCISKNIRSSSHISILLQFDSNIYYCRHA